MTRTLFFDTETTDLISNTLLPLDKQPRIIEFFGQIVDENGNKLQELEFYCNPGIIISETVTKITGIKTEDVKNEPPFSARADEVIALIESADEIAAHNLSYDMFVVDADLARIKKTVKWPKKQICTVENTEWMCGFRLSLSNLYERLFGEPFSGAHRARADVEALTKCFLHLRSAGDI